MNSRLLSIKAERRAVAIAVFQGSTLRYAEVLTLSSDPEAAQTSAVGFINRTLDRFKIDSAVLEDAVTSEESRSAELIHALEQAISAAGIPTRRIGKQALFESYAVTPLTTRRELHDVIAAIWPQLGTPDFHPSVQDAAAAGLHVQTECRLLG